MSRNLAGYLAIIIVFLACKSRGPVTEAESDKNVEDAKAEIAQPATDPAPVKSQADDTVSAEAPAVEPSPAFRVMPEAKSYCASYAGVFINDTAIQTKTLSFNVNALATANSSAVLDCVVPLTIIVPKGHFLDMWIDVSSFLQGKAEMVSGDAAMFSATGIAYKEGTTSILMNYEYETKIQGPIYSDADFVRSMNILRKKTMDCVTADTLMEIGMQFMATVQTGTGGIAPKFSVTKLPPVSYSIKKCQ